MAEPSRLYYVYDPMCSWCYAFVNSWSALQRALPEDVEVVYVLGGLAPDTTEPMPEAMRNMIRQTWRKIEETVPGVHFNFDFWTLNTPVRSTYPACRAILAAGKQNPAAGVEMLRAIQHAYYQSARNPSLLETLQECAEAIGLNGAAFRSDLTSDNTDAVLHQELQLAAELNAFSFPSLRLMHQGAVYPIAVDYRDHHTMLKEIDAVINGK